MNDDDELAKELSHLPPRDLDDLAAERVRRRAQSVLAAERRLAERPWLVPVAHAWSRVVAPVLVAGAVGGYLTWAVTFVGALYR